MAEHYNEVYKRFYAKLVQSLPLTDAHFRAALVSKQLFCGDLLDQVEAKRTNAERNGSTCIEPFKRRAGLGY